MLNDQQAVVKDESYWKNLIQQQITATPRLKPQESYEQFYNRISSELLQPIAALANINDNLSPSGSPALHTLAMQAESYEIIFKNVLANLYIEVDKRDTLNATALQYAAIYGHYDFVAMLIEKRCDIYAKTTQRYPSWSKHSFMNDCSAFEYAVMKGYCNIAELLLTHEQKNGFEYNRGRFLKQSPDRLFKLACTTGNLELVKLLLRFGFDINSAINSWGSAELIYTACQSGNLELVQLLIQQFSANKLTSPVLDNAASKAAQKGYSNILRYLVNLGASIDLESAFSSQDKDTILTAISLTANINKAGRGNVKPLHLAAKFGDTEVIQTLLNRGAYQDISKLTSRGETPLDFAINAGQAQAVRLLINAGSSLYHMQQGRISDTALHQACLTNSLETVLVVYELGGSRFINQQNQDGHTPLHYAVGKAVKKEGNQDIVAFLLKKGANSNIGETPLFTALEYENYPIAELLIKYGANPIAIGDKRQTCLHRAARIQDIKFLELLLSNNIKCDLHTKAHDYNDGATPFLVAVSYANREHVKRLLQEGANINDVNEDGDNCLHLLAKCYTGETQVYNLAPILLERGAKHLLNKPNKQGLTPIHSAAKQQDYSLMLLYIRSLPETANLSTDKQLQQILANNLVEKRSQYRLDRKFEFFLTDQQSDLQGIAPELAQPLVSILAKEAALMMEYNNNDESGTELFKLILEKIPASERSTIINAHLSVDRSHYKYAEKNGKTLLFLAVKAKRKDIVEILLKLGAEANIACYCRNEFDKNGWYDDKLLLITPFTLAVIKNNVDLVKLFLANKIIRLDEHVYTKTTLINKNNRYASSNTLSAEDSAIEHTLTHGIELKDRPELYTHIPLVFYAIANKHHEILELLFSVATSADLLIRSRHYKSFTRDISFLPEFYSIGVTPLLYAIRLNDHKAVNIIARNQDTINDVIEQVSPLLLAAIYCDEVIVKTLLAQGADIEFCARNGSSPLMLAVKTNKVDNAQVLLEKGAKVDVANSEGITPMMWAVAKGYFSLVQLLAEFNADLSKIKPKVILSACTTGNLPTINFLMERGFDPNACNENGISYLMAAAKFKHSEIIEALIKAGADVNKLSLKGTSALDFTIVNADDKSFAILLSAGAKLQPIEGQDKFYKLAEAAVTNNNILVMQALVNAGFDLSKTEPAIKREPARHWADEPYTESSSQQTEGAQQDDDSVIIDLRGLKNLQPIRRNRAQLNIAGKSDLVSLKEGVDDNLRQDTQDDLKKSIIKPLNSKKPISVQTFSLSDFDIAKDDNSSKGIRSDNHKLAIKLLHIAAKEGYIEIIKLLIAAKADINATKQITHEYKVSSDYRAHRYHTHDGYDDDDYDDYYESRFDRYNDRYHSVTVTVSPLHLAILSNQLEAAQVLIELGADINQTTHEGGAGAIHLLLNNKEFGNQQQALLQLLIDRGVNINQISDCKYNNYPGLPSYKATPLYIAYKNDNINVMTILLKTGALCGLDLVESGVIQKPLLNIAIEEDNQNAIELLLLYGGLVLPNLNFTADGNNLMLASIEDDDDNDRFSSENFEDELPAWRLETPLHTAARQANPDSALKILKYYPGLYNDQNKDGQTAEKVAISHNCMTTAAAIRNFVRNTIDDRKSNVLLKMNLKFFKPYNENAKKMPFSDVEIFSTNKL